MAESNFSPPLHNPFALPTPPGTHAQGQDISRGYPSYSSMAYESPSFNHYHAGPFGSQLPDHNAPFYPFQQGRGFHYHHFSSHAGPRAAGFYPPSVFQNGPNTGPTPSVATGAFHNMHSSGGSHSDYPESRNDMLPMIEPPTPGAQPYSLPSYSQVSSPPMHGYNPFPNRRPGPAMPNAISPPSGRFGGDVGQYGNEGGVRDQSRHLTSPTRRASYDRQHQHNSQAPGGPDRRSLPFLSAHARRSDRSVSPRTSNNRRSFDRYSTDLSHASTSSDQEEAAARTRLNRIRPHRQRPEFRSRYVAAADGNTPTASQMQDLKQKLRHFLPNQLPEGTSTACDICQKDYSTKYVTPTEEEEVAVQLPCKHVFGEHCINTWFETCKTHKNKVTCPMCRKLLIEPRPSASFFTTMPEMMAFFSSRPSSLNAEERQAIQQLASSREVQGDLAHI